MTILKSAASALACANNWPKLMLIVQYILLILLCTAGVPA